MVVHVYNTRGKLQNALAPDNLLPTALGLRSIRLPKQTQAWCAIEEFQFHDSVSAS